MGRTHLAFLVRDRSYFAIIKKEIHTLVLSAGFPARKVAEIDIIVSEILTNIVKHAGSGTLLLKITAHIDQQQELELIAFDKGPGMADVNRMMNDGVSTTNTLGGGLGALKRLSDDCQIYSQKNWGTIVLIRVLSKPNNSRAKSPKALVRSILVPKPGESQCGDGSYYTVNDQHLKLLLCDGLGHGPDAAKVAELAGQAFLDYPTEDPVDMIGHLNVALKRTRGAVATVAIFDLKKKIWSICGIGNIMTKILSREGHKNYMPYNGIVGLNVPRNLKTQQIMHDDTQQLVMCSDGIRSRWDMLKYHGITRYDPSVFCAALLNDYARNTDDIGILTCKINAAAYVRTGQGHP
ncbi:ATP-binding protein [Chitinophaga pendula]|uniref:ATP-binding protein n=1 Tax=Chitinophaga TaxID=79328 RepID=UPI000BB0CC1C|nr:MULTISPECIES: ATP-binding protein [Chitinophaga]ASZ11926.1 serine/threonine protein kinase [Chitinophaga sp. MD30]UCJ05045.1 ATP-binding protein [Chitinophaga pendula]